MNKNATGSDDSDANNNELFVNSSPNGNMRNVSDDWQGYDSAYEEDTDLMTYVLNDSVTAKLAISGLIGKAAAAAIVSTKKRTPYSFETSPSIRNRQKNRLMKKLQHTLHEYSIRVGEQAIALITTPPNKTYQVIGSQPLVTIVKKFSSEIINELQYSLNEQTIPILETDATLFELPPLIIDGIPTPLETLTQKQLRTFIPLMLKYSTSRGKPGWGKASLKPIWWPYDVPWTNIRMDSRSNDEKKKIPWTNALRKVIINCYKFHDRTDLLCAFTDDNLRNSTYQLHTNSDGTDKSIQNDPNNPIITLPDGTKAKVLALTTLQSEFYDSSNQSLDVTCTENINNNDEINAEGSSQNDINFNPLKGTQLSDDGELSLTFENKCFDIVNSVINIPIPVSVYETITSISQMSANSDVTICFKKPSS